MCIRDSDMSTPKGDGSFNVYDDIRTKLLAAVVPESEVEFIHNADTEGKKADLFSKVRSGKVRVLLGSGNIDYAWLGACSSDGLNWTWFDGSEMKYTYWMPEHPYEWPDSALVAYVSGEWTLFADAPQMAVQGFITEQFTGKKGLRGVRAEVKDGEIIVDVYLMVRYGYVIPETARKVQDSVSAAVSGMTGYNVHAVNVHVGGISFN